MLTREEINIKVEKLKSGTTCNFFLFPIDVIKIANDLGYKIFPLDDNELDISGKVNMEEKSIYINTKDMERRQRFTIAHEIAHVFLQHQDKNGKNVQLRDPDFSVYNNDPHEIEANLFAVTLLMPEKEFRKSWERYSGFVNDVADYFGVSSLAVSIRANDLALLSI